MSAKPGFLDELAARRRFGMRQGLEVIRDLLARLDHPERELAAVHVAGTNGKGSVVALVDAVLRAAGLHTGRYTSPHLLHFNERIWLDGRPVSDAALAVAAEGVERAARAAEAAGGEPPTFFECATAVAFDLFRREGLRLVVIETGLGGRLDATNVLDPLVSVITRIGLEHTQWLGDTLEKIAAEKGGIIKPGRPVVCGAMPGEARGVIVRMAAACGSPFVDAAEGASVMRAASGLDGLTVRVATPSRDLGKVQTPLAGAFQLENIATAVAALEATEQRLGMNLPDEAFRTGLRQVCWPGRFQLVVRTPPVIVDGAHNPDGAAALRLALKQTGFRGPVALVAGFCDDKDSATFLRTLAPVVKRAWAVPVPSARGLPMEEVRDRMAASGMVTETGEMPAALAAAQAWAQAEHGLVLVCGSLFLVGQVLDHLHAFPWQVSGDRLPDENEQIKPGGARP
jgi:dihydrofolate synthase/folylpolyglutamate synthase